jgi:hypothetical protein
MSDDAELVREADECLTYLVDHIGRILRNEPVRDLAEAVGGAKNSVRRLVARIEAQAQEIAALKEEADYYSALIARKDKAIADMKNEIATMDAERRMPKIAELRVIVDRTLVPDELRVHPAGFDALQKAAIAMQNYSYPSATGGAR